MLSQKVYLFFLLLPIFVDLCAAQKPLVPFYSQAMFTQSPELADTIIYKSMRNGVDREIYFTKEFLGKVRYNNRLLGSVEEISSSTSSSARLVSKPFFTTSFLKNYAAVNSFIINPPEKYAHCKGVELAAFQADGYPSRAYFFDRKSNILIVAAPGFGYAKEIMTPFVELFPRYDILLLEHRGHGQHVQLDSIYDKVLHTLWGVAPSLVKTGQPEVDDLINWIGLARKRVGYQRHKKVLGIGFCYSSLLFSTAAAQKPALFTHLVFDGAILALADVFMRMQKDVSLLSSVFIQGLGASLVQHIPGYKAVMMNGQATIFSTALASTLSNFDTFPLLKLPVLIFQGQADKLVAQDDFQLLFDRLATKKKLAIITPHRHLLTYLKEKELYAWTIERFLQNVDLTSLS